MPRVTLRLKLLSGVSVTVLWVQVRIPVRKYAHELGSPLFGLRSGLLCYRSTAISPVPWVRFVIGPPGGGIAPAKTFGRFGSREYRSGGQSIVPWICQLAPRRARLRASPRILLWW